MTRGALAVAMLMLLLPVSSAGPLLPGQNDAGSGQDAGDVPTEALQLPAQGHYNGTLKPATEADWYTVDAPPIRTQCLHAVVGGQALGTATLAVNDQLLLNTTRAIKPYHSLELGIAAPNIRHPVLGVQGEVPGFDPLLPIPLPVPVQAGQDYNFSLRTFTPTELGPGDGGSGRDAGNDISEAVPVPGGCIGGQIGGGDDLIDTYIFDGEEGDPLSLSLAMAASAPAQLRLVSPDGEDTAKVAAGGFEEVVLNQSGQWVLKAELPGQSGQVLEMEYITGFSLNGPRPEPCRPSCFLMES